MKLQKLTIHNIASIEDAVIDFEAEPLAGSEVFLITGKTGAGKSTILDAICLALFADTPRLDGTQMEGGTLDGGKTVQIDDPRQLMRRNTGEAFTSLTFTGSNGVHYKATWSVARAHQKVNGNIQKKIWELKNLDTDFAFTKDSDIRDELKMAIGLDFNQFCRTTMLAQGEFTRFLNSKDQEKAAILEKITGVDAYSKIGAKVYEITSQKESDWREAQRLVEGTHTLSDEEIAEKQAALSDLERQGNEIKAGSKADVQKRDWINTANQLAAKKSEAEVALRQAKETVESEAFKEKAQLVTDWNATIDARHWMTEAAQASRSQREQQENLQQLATTYSTLLGGERYAAYVVTQIEEEILKVKESLLSEEGRKSVYENAQTLVGHLKGIEAGRKTIAQIQENLAAERKKLTELLTPALEKATQEAHAAKAAFEEEEAQVKAREESVAALNLSEMRKQRDGAKDLLQKIDRAQEGIGAHAEAKAKYEETEQNLVERKRAMQVKWRESALLVTPIYLAKGELDMRKADLDKQSDTVDQFVSKLRLKLQVGDTCPVCRQRIKAALPREEVLAVVVEGLQKAYDEAEKKYTELVDAQRKIDAEVEAESQIYDRDEKAFKADKSVAQAEQKAKSACLDCGLTVYDDSTLSQLENLAASTRRAYDEWEGKITDGERLDAEAKRCRNALETKRKSLEALATRVTQAERAKGDCEGRISTAETLVGTKKQEVESFEQNVEALMAGRWTLDWKASPKAFADALTVAANQYNLQVQQKQRLESQLGPAQTLAKHVQEALNSLCLSMPAWKEIAPTAVAPVENLLARVNALNASVATALGQLKSAEESLVANQRKLDGFLAEHPHLGLTRLAALNAYSAEAISHEEESLKSAHNAVDVKSTLLGIVDRQLAEHQAHKPALSEEDTLEALSERIAGVEVQLTDLGEKRGTILQLLDTDRKIRESLGALVEDAERKKGAYNRWNRLNELIGDATGNKFRKIAQSYVLANLIHSANAYMKSLTNRYTLKVTPGTFVIAIEDAYQGCVSRAASTISGGESFLVSLSLALALSDIGQSLSVDTLFIDEGFGTLSGEPLQNAINTLRSLHTKAGRHVGIISHVEELQERIPVQIQVNQEGNSSSSVVEVRG